MKPDQTLRLQFGLFAPPIAEQLKSYNVEKKDTDNWQKQAAAIDRLRITSILTHSESDKAYQRLLKSIVKHLNTTFTNHVQND